MPTVDDLSTAQKHLIHTAAVRLQDKFEGIFGPETIERYINDSLDQLLPTSEVVSFVPIFVERFAKDRLRALAKVEGRIISDKPSVMILCVHNAGRSQMAAGWLKFLTDERVDVFSGGSEPASQINPAAIEAMAEVGIDIRTEFPKPWTDEITRAADIVITMGCGDACPVYPGKRYEDWVLDDPEGLDLEGVRPIRDEIRGRVEELIAQLDIAPQASKSASR
jgi:arsenate reductase (thioredoxin)